MAMPLLWFQLSPFSNPFYLFFFRLTFITSLCPYPSISLHPPPHSTSGQCFASNFSHSLAVGGSFILSLQKQLAGSASPKSHQRSWWNATLWGCTDAFRVHPPLPLELSFDLGYCMPLYYFLSRTNRFSLFTK